MAEDTYTLMCFYGIQCLFNPADLGLVSVVGQGIFKVFRTGDSNLKLLPNALAKRDAQNYTCHAWMPEGSAEKERIVIGTDSGEMLVVDGGELRSVLPSDSGQGVESIATTSKGFVAGHEGGLLSIWEKVDGEERPYRRTKVFHVEGHSVKVCAFLASRLCVCLVTDSNAVIICWVYESKSRDSRFSAGD